MNDISKSTVSLSSPRGSIVSIPTSTTFIEFKLEETEQSIGDRFEKTVVQHSKQLAVKDRTCELTYGELSELANRVAQSILSQNKESGQRVALLLGHRAQTIAAILGVLKSGNLYVPLDPAVPDSRNSFILNDSQSGVVITNTENLSLAKQLVGNSRQLINIDCIDRTVADESVRPRISPDDLAYILYTSGSTGQPKGVVQNHRNVLRVVRRYTNGLKISSQDRLTHLASFSVTASVANMFSAILNGAALFLFDVKEEGVAKLADWLIKNDITFYHSVASVFRNFAVTLTGPAQLPRLRVIRLGGDRVYRSDVDLYKKHFSDNCLFVNAYGASEISSVTLYCIDKSTAVIDDNVPVGWSLDDTTLSLVDEDGKKVAFNAVGEIVIKGRSLSLGYWQKPELTHAVFKSNSQDDDERTYHTGDTGYLLPDGCLVHTGRKDFQTKIRGFRVELGEIGRVLCTLATIKEAVVVVRADQFGENQLVAYVVPHSGHALERSDLRHFLTGQLPDYMIPSFFVLLDALPLTPSGKVDRNALPEPDKTYVGGAGVARLEPNRAELEAESLLPDIELGAIEAVLAEHPDVRQAVVHLWKLKADDVRLVACCVPAKAGVLASVTLRKHLRAKLPDHMIPQYFLKVEEIPLTPTGQVDRRRLPTPVVAESGIGQHEAPADSVEVTIAEIWTRLIQPARPIGRRDTFFDMGGHSLLAGKALLEIERELNVKLELRVLFRESLADIATICQSQRRQGLTTAT